MRESKGESWRRHTIIMSVAVWKEGKKDNNVVFGYGKDCEEKQMGLLELCRHDQETFRIGMCSC